MATKYGLKMIEHMQIIEKKKKKKKKEEISWKEELSHPFTKIV